MRSRGVFTFTRVVAGLGITLGLTTFGCTVEVVDPHDEMIPPEEVNVSQEAVYDCTTWQDTGYVDGKPFLITLVTVDKKPVEVETANAYIVMQEAAAKSGVNIRIVSGFRTYAEQEYLYNCYITKSCNNGNLAAKPGYSEHQSGHALDLNTSTSGVLNWLEKHGITYGFKRTVSSEPWHWEWWGGGPGGGPCAGGNKVTKCDIGGGIQGECISTSMCSAYGGSYKSTPGFCPGPADIQCCTGKTECTANGKTGECLRTEVCKEKGADYVSTPGFCPGPSYFQCCTSTKTEDPSPPPPPQDDGGTEDDGGTAGTGTPESGDPGVPGDPGTADAGAADSGSGDVGYTAEDETKPPRLVENEAGATSQSDDLDGLNGFGFTEDEPACQVSRVGSCVASPIALLASLLGLVALRRFRSVRPKV